MFRVYPKDHDPSLFYFDLCDPISEIQKTLSKDMNDDIKFAVSNIDDKSKPAITFCDKKMTLDEVQDMDKNTVLHGSTHQLISFTVGS